MTDREDLVFARLDQLERNLREDVERLHEKMDAAARNGCPHHNALISRVEDHEVRIRNTEAYQLRQAGQTAIIGSGGGFAAAAVIWLGRVLLTRIFG